VAKDNGDVKSTWGTRGYETNKRCVFWVFWRL
jgi:hypothetical protein